MTRAFPSRRGFPKATRACGGNGGGTLNVLIDLFALVMFHLIQLIAELYILYIIIYILYMHICGTYCNLKLKVVVVGTRH